MNPFFFLLAGGKRERELFQCFGQFLIGKKSWVIKDQQGSEGRDQFPDPGKSGAVNPGSQSLNLIVNKRINCISKLCHNRAVTGRQNLQICFHKKMCPLSDKKRRRQKSTRLLCRLRTDCIAEAKKSQEKVRNAKNKKRT